MQSVQAKPFLALQGPKSDTTQSLELSGGREPFRQEIMFDFYNQLKHGITWNMQQCNQQVPTDHEKHIGLDIQGEGGNKMTQK